MSFDLHSRYESCLESDAHVLALRLKHHACFVLALLRLRSGGEHVFTAVATGRVAGDACVVDESVSKGLRRSHVT